jgi:pimeloyl-ACP methyl ester carboxylesterase
MFLKGITVSTHHVPSSTLRRILLATLSAFIGLMLFAGPGMSARPAASTAVAAAAHATTGPKPTIVLIHGAFADASGWDSVMTRLQHRGYTVLAPANPLRGVATDSTYIASVLASIRGPIVLVGHSYGGEVITNAATGNPNVKALVYIAAFAPDLHETSGALATKFPGSMLTPQNLTFRPFSGGVDGYISPSVFRNVFAADVPAETAALMAASQRPGALSTLSELSGVPAWKTIPSWYMVANQDHAIPPAVERFMAARMHAHTVQIDSSHAAMVSHPGAVTALILSAVQAVQ